jgi:hypothetical protein
VVCFIGICPTIPTEKSKILEHILNDWEKTLAGGAKNVA